MFPSHDVSQSRYGPETPEPSQVSRNGYFRISRTPDNLEEWDNEDMDQSLEEILKELED